MMGMARAGWLMGASCVFAAVAVASTNPQAVAPSPRALEALQLLKSDDPYQRQLGFLRLEALREISTVDTIISYVDSGDPNMRAYSLRAVAAIEGAPAVPLLLQKLRTDGSPLVRRATLLGLEPLQPADATVLPALLKALRDRSAEVRMAAVDIVSRIDDARAREAVLARYRREDHKDVRRVLQMAIKRIQAQHGG